MCVKRVQSGWQIHIFKIIRIKGFKINSSFAPGFRWWKYSFVCMYVPEISFQRGFASPVLAGKRHRDQFVRCCCLSVVVWKWPRLKSWSLVGTKFGLGLQHGKFHLLKMLRSHIEVKVHLRSNYNVKLASFEKLKFSCTPNLVYWYKMGSFVCSCGQRSSEVKL